MKTYNDFAQSNVSEKITLAILKGAKRVVGWSSNEAALDSMGGVSVTANGRALTESELPLSQDEFCYDRELKKITVRLENDEDANDSFIVVTQEFYFASKALSLPHDLNDGFEVFFEPLVKSSSLFGVELDTINQGTEAIEGSGSLVLINDFDFWKKNFDKITFDNQECRIYSYFPALPASQAKLIFKGFVESKSYGQNITLKLKDLMSSLRDSVNLPTIGSLEERNPASLSEAYQRMIFGRVRGFRPVNLDGVLNSAYPLSGNVTFTNASATVTGSGTEFLKELSPEDVLVINDVEYTVAAIASDTSLTLTENYADVTTSKTIEFKPKHDKRFINRKWKLASHPLNEPVRTIQAGSSTSRLFLDSTLDIVAGDEIYVGVLGSGLLVTVDKVLNDTQILLKNSLPTNPSAGTVVRRPAVQSLKINQTELRYYRDYEADALNATITLRETAEVNAEQAKESVQSATFTNGSRTVTGSGTSFKTLVEPGFMIRPKGTVDFYEVLAVNSDTEIILRTPATSTKTDKVQFKSLILNDETVLSCEVTGKESQGKLLKTAPEIVHELLKDIVPSEMIDSTSFSEAMKFSNENLSFSVPKKFDEKKLPTYRDIVNEVSRSVFGVLYQNADFKFAYDIMRPKAGKLSVLKLDETDCLSLNVQHTNKNVVKTVFVEYARREFDDFINDEIVEIASKESLTAKYVLQTGKTRTFTTLLSNKADAERMAARWSFLLENSAASVSISTKLQAVNLKINDVFLLSHKKMFERFSGNSSSKMLLVESIKKSASGVEIGAVDLSNAFNRVCFISDTATNYSSTSEDEKLSAGFYTDASGIIDNDANTHGTNLIW